MVRLAPTTPGSRTPIDVVTDDPPVGEDGELGYEFDEMLHDGVLPGLVTVMLRLHDVVDGGEQGVAGRHGGPRAGERQILTPDTIWNNRIG